MRTPWLCLLIAPWLLSSTACVSGSAVDVHRVLVPEGPIDLGVVAFDQRARHTLTLTNPGSASAQVRLSITQGFVLAADAVRVPAGGQIDVILNVTPDSYAPLTGALTLQGPDFVEVREIVGLVNEDLDGDGFRAIGAGGDDCDDTRADVHPGAPEVCDGRDNNCDGQVDVDAVDARPFFADRDRDGYGDPDSAERACVRPAGFVDDDTDCDDTRADVNPGATEIADGIDQDCNGLIDEHLLVPRSLPTTEIGLAGDFGPGGFVELRARGSTTLYLQNVELRVDDDRAPLPPLVAPPGTLLVFCGLSEPAALGDVACDAALPGPIGPDAQIALTALTTFETLDVAPLGFEDRRSMELAPAAALSGQNADPSSWCPSTTDLDDERLASPGTLAGHCEGP